MKFDDMAMRMGREGIIIFHALRLDVYMSLRDVNFCFHQIFSSLA